MSGQSGWPADWSNSISPCGGDVADPDIIDLSDWLTPGDHTVTWRVEDIRPKDPGDDDGHHGYWRVSASLAGWK